jgi:alpha-tubulin suppressor-like RCC1 family protein
MCVCVCVCVHIYNINNYNTNTNTNNNKKTKLTASPRNTGPGRLFTWGSGGKGKLGHGGTEDELSPRLVTGVLADKVDL